MTKEQEQMMRKKIAERQQAKLPASAKWHLNHKPYLENRRDDNGNSDAADKVPGEGPEKIPKEMEAWNEIQDAERGIE